MLTFGGRPAMQEERPNDDIVSGDCLKHCHSVLYIARVAKIQSGSTEQVRAAWKMDATRT